MRLGNNMNTETKLVLGVKKQSNLPKAPNHKQKHSKQFKEFRLTQKQYDKLAAKFGTVKIDQNKNKACNSS